VREICTLRLTRRELDTWQWWNGEPNGSSKEPAWKPFTYRARASSRPYRKVEWGNAVWLRALLLPYSA
jgi:hypothetical protein